MTNIRMMGWDGFGLVWFALLSSAISIINNTCMVYHIYTYLLHTAGDTKNMNTFFISNKTTNL